MDTEVRKDLRNFVFTPTIFNELMTKLEDDCTKIIKLYEDKYINDGFDIRLVYPRRPDLIIYDNPNDKSCSGYVGFTVDKKSDKIFIPNTIIGINLNGIFNNMSILCGERYINTVQDFIRNTVQHELFHWCQMKFGYMESKRYDDSEDTKYLLEKQCVEERIEYLSGEGKDIYPELVYELAALDWLQFKKDFRQFESYEGESLGNDILTSYDRIEKLCKR